MNYAELQEEINTSPTIEQCARMGSTHAAYGWGKNPYSWWPETHRAAYVKEYEAEKAKNNA